MISGNESAIIILSYILGCISSGYYLVKIFKGTDIRKHASGSTGARNVGRILGKKGFAATLSCDIIKGAGIMILCRYLHFSDLATSLSMIALVIGHIFPIQLGFHGGKGVIVTIGALLVFDYLLAGCLTISFFLLLLITKKYMLSGMAAIGLLCLFVFFRNHSPIEIFSVFTVVILILFAHRSNIRKEFTNKTTPANTEELPCR
jgi:glycerol-3-phosphate acyltransferase PlsY